MSITVRFTGICTHLTELASKKHRVVLVRADNGAHLNDAAIPPHIPKLRIAPEHVLSITGYPHGLEPLGPDGLWQIRGVSFHLEGVLGDGVQRDGSFSDVPRLACDSPRPAASYEVTHNEQAACYFDLHTGTIIATHDSDYAPYNTEVTVEPGEGPTLVATCFWNRKSAYFHLAQDAVIDFEHTGHQKGDTDNDYLLHYRILENVPADAKVPHNPTRVNGHPGDVSIGCSNSQYP